MLHLRRHHATKVGGVSVIKKELKSSAKLKHHAAKAGGVPTVCAKLGGGFRSYDRALMS
jgi:hypothetical protein